MENKAVLENRQYFNIVIGIYRPWIAAQVIVCVAHLIQVFAKIRGVPGYVSRHVSRTGHLYPTHWD